MLVYLYKRLPLDRALALNSKPQNVTHTLAIYVGSQTTNLTSVGSRKPHIMDVVRKGTLRGRVEVGVMPDEVKPGGLTRSSSSQIVEMMETLTICYIDRVATRPIYMELLLNGNPCDIEVDTGAAVSILSEKQVSLGLIGAQLQKTSVSLRTYTSQKILVKGKLQLQLHGTRLA